MYQKDVPKRFSSSASFRLTQRMAAASSRRPRRTLAIWGLLVLVALVLAGTSLKGLTTTAHVVGTTQSAQAEALYNEVVRSAARSRPMSSWSAPRARPPAIRTSRHS